MATIGEMLTELAGVKQDIKNSLTAKGQVVGNDFTTYAGAVDNIQSGTMKSPKTLLVMTAGQFDEFYNEEENCERQGEQESIRIDFYYPKDEDPSINFIEVHQESSTLIHYKNNSIAEYVDLDAAFDVIYGSGTYVYTYLSGIDLVNYVNTLAASYDLTTEEYTENSEMHNVTFVCNEIPEPEPEPEPTPEEPTV